MRARAEIARDIAGRAGTSAVETRHLKMTALDWELTAEIVARLEEQTQATKQLAAEMRPQRARQDPDRRHPLQIPRTPLRQVEQWNNSLKSKGYLRAHLEQNLRLFRLGSLLRDRNHYDVPLFHLKWEDLGDSGQRHLQTAQAHSLAQSFPRSGVSWSGFRIQRRPVK